MFPICRKTLNALNFDTLMVSVTESMLQREMKVNHISVKQSYKLRRRFREFPFSSSTTKNIHHSQFPQKEKQVHDGVECVFRQKEMSSRSPDCSICRPNVAGRLFPREQRTSSASSSCLFLFRFTNKWRIAMEPTLN